MPLQVDHTRPVRTVDTHGSVIATETNGSAPIKHVDSVGREVQADAAKVAEQAAAAAFGADAPKEGEKPKEGEAKEPTAADVRKAYLEAQKEKRQASSLLKLAKAKLADADGYALAKAKVESGEDPMALLNFAKIDPVKNYQEMTKRALAEPKPPEDPREKSLREHEERLKKYQEDLEVKVKTIQDREDLDQKNTVIKERVIPLIERNEEKYESLLAEYGAQTAVQVFQTVWDIYQQTGVARSFEEVADEMEAYWTEKVDSGLKAAAKLKKFQSRFAQSGPGPSETPDQPVRSRSVTLSNKPSVSTFVPTSSPVRKRGQTKDERVAEILAKFKDVP